MVDETHHNEDQAKQLAELLAPIVTNSIQNGIDQRLVAMEKEVSSRLDGIASKNAELLEKLHCEKDARLSLEERMANLPDEPNGEPKPTEIVLDRVNALDPVAYRKAKAKAEKTGVPLRIDRGVRNETP